MRPGAVNFLQKFGSALRVNPHFHALVIDAVYVTERPGAVPTFRPAPPLTDLDAAVGACSARRSVGAPQVRDGYDGLRPASPLTP